MICFMVPARFSVDGERPIEMRGVDLPYDSNHYNPNGVCCQPLNAKKSKKKLIFFQGERIARSRSVASAWMCGRTCE